MKKERNNSRKGSSEALMIRSADRKFPICSIIRPTATKEAAMGAVAALTADGLFMGQTKPFFDLIKDLAADADAAKREFEGEF